MNLPSMNFLQYLNGGVKSRWRLWPHHWLAVVRHTINVSTPYKQI